MVAGVFKLNSQLTVRTPQGTSHARAKGFNPKNVRKFFEVYEPEFRKINSQPHRLFNVDETGITVVQQKHSKVISLNGKKEVGKLTFVERGCLITIITCMNTVGTYVSPMMEKT
jgi:hypothetical protein